MGRIQDLLQELGYEVNPIQAHCDNEGTISSVKMEPGNDGKGKHLHILFKFIKQHIESGQIKLQHITTRNQIADLLTKPHPPPRFQQLCRMCAMATAHKA